MEYEDEIERMRARKRRGERKTGRSRTEPGSYGYGHGGRDYNGGRAYDYDREEALERARRIRKHKRKKKLILAELIVMVLVVAGAAFLVLNHKTNQKGYWTIAIFGVDSRDGNLNKGALSDVEMLCSINKETGEIKLVSIYRDTYLQIDSQGTFDKVNEAYFKGGHKQATYAINENLDLKVDNYATFNWKAVAEAINILGGIDLEITDKEFAYINSFITETVNSTGIGSYQLKSAGLNHLDGVQAVAYARLRLMDTDFNRTERQRKVVMLALEKAKQADFSVLNNILVTVLPQVNTDVGIDDLIPMAMKIKDYHIGETAGFPFSRTTMKIGKRDCVIATTLESNVKDLHGFLFGDTEYSPSASVRRISKKISEASGIYEPGQKAPNKSGSSGGKAKETKAPAETTAPPETSPTQESTQAAVEETTAEETTAEETTEHPTDENGKLIGPGAEIDSSQQGESEKETEETGQPTAGPTEEQPGSGQSEGPESTGPEAGSQPQESKSGEQAVPASPEQGGKPESGKPEPENTGPGVAVR